MINNFETIGSILLDKEGFFEMQESVEKRKILLIHQALKPYARKNKSGELILDGRAICLNFDLDKALFQFELSNSELIAENKNDFFAFRLGAPKDKKKFLSTNNIDTFFSPLFAQSIEYIKTKRQNKRSKNWFSENLGDGYEKLMNQILDTFYAKDGKEYILDSSKLVSDQRHLFEQIKEEQSSNTKPKELYSRFLNKFFFNSDSKNTIAFPSICMVLLNNQHILDFDSRKLKNDYINLCYYDLLGRFFIEETKKDKQCHICDAKGDVIQNIPFPMKFYGTTNNLNFENVKNSNAYKSFAICKSCFQKTLTGMKHVEQYYNDYLFDTNYYLIPHLSNHKSMAVFKKLNSLFKVQKRPYKEIIETIKLALIKAKIKTARFDLFFYFSPAGSQQFDVLQIISNIDMEILLTKLALFDQASEHYGLGKIGDYDSSLTIYDLRFFLFPSTATHSGQPDSKTYRKDLLNFLSCFLGDRSFNYNDLIARFVSIYKKRLNRDNENRLSPFKMILFLSIMLKLNRLKGGNSLKKGNSVSEVLKSEYREFFTAHQEVYANDAFRQGLFLLGTIISKIKYAQQKKGKKANFLKKLNFNGFPARRLPTLVAQVKDYAEIYQVYEESGIWGNTMDRLQGIESSRMKPDEIVFYILSGISFEDYLGMKFKYEQDQKANKNP